MPLEVIRTEAGIPTTRFCQLVGIPERTYRRWQAYARAGARSKVHGRSRHTRLSAR